MMHEIEVNLEVLLLLVFMVAGIYFMKDLLLFLFTKLVIRVRNKTVLSLAFIIASAFLSAFLDALTVVAVIIAVGLGFYTIYHKVASGKEFHHDHDHTSDELVSKGETLESDAKDKFKETTSEVESRVADVRKKLGLDTDDTDQKIEELSAKVDALTEAVAKLAANK